MGATKAELEQFERRLGVGPRKPILRSDRTKLEDRFDRAWSAYTADEGHGHRLATPELAPFTDRPRMRLDRAWPVSKVAVEIHGGTWSGGRHVSGAGFQRDCEKRCLAARDGWALFEFTADMVKADEWYRILAETIDRRYRLGERHHE